jgi:hypothetical protein
MGYAKLAGSNSICQLLRPSSAAKLFVPNATFQQSKKLLHFSTLKAPIDVPRLRAACLAAIKQQRPLGQEPVLSMIDVKSFLELNNLFLTLPAPSSSTDG